MKKSTQRRRRPRHRTFDPVILAFLTGPAFLTGCTDVDINGPDSGWDGGGRVWNTDHAAEAYFSQEIGPVATLSLSGVAGQVEIIGSGNAPGIVVDASLRVRSYSTQDARAHLDELAVEIRETGSTAFVETRQPARTGGRKYEVDYRIQVPDRTNLIVVQAAGPVEIRSVSGTVDLDLAAGAVTLFDLTGDIRAAVAAGSLDATVALLPRGQVDLRVAAGSIVLSVPRQTSTWLRAAVAAGTIRVVDLALVDQDPRASVLEASLGGGDGTIRLETAAGDITVKGR
jgi:hypothetical protein